MDAFYAAIEQRDPPRASRRPVVVGGTASRGVVTAASYESASLRHPLGHAAAGGAPALPRRGVPPRRHGEVSPRQPRGAARVRQREPRVEPLSLDEAFIDVTASVALLGPPLTIGRLLRERVRSATGLAVSVGIAAGKMVAKIASDVAKPDGLLEVPADAVRAFLDPLPSAVSGRRAGDAGGARGGGHSHRRRRHARDAGGTRGRRRARADHLARLAAR
jgi:DNA polymerase-4